ncbi:hypothetical protein [Streptomyces zhihengii]
MPLAFLKRTKETPVTTTDSTDTETSAGPVMQFRTQGGATVDLYPHQWVEHHYAVGDRPARTLNRSGFEWRCNGCDLTGAEQHLRLRGAGYTETKPQDSRNDANAHATDCWAMPKPTV